VHKTPGELMEFKHAPCPASDHSKRHTSVTSGTRWQWHSGLSNTAVFINSS